MWNCYSWSLITMKFNLLLISMHHDWMEDSSLGLTLKCKMHVHWLHFLKEKWHWEIKVSSLRCENSKEMLAHELSFEIMDSKILGFLDFLAFSLLELTMSPTICCCIIVRSGWKTTAENDLGLCSPELTAAIVWSGTMEVPVKVSK